MVTSRYMIAFMLRPEQKRCNNMLSGKDKFGPACINIENLAWAAPIDSFSYCSKSRIALGRETIQAIGKMQDKTYL